MFLANVGEIYFSLSISSSFVSKLFLEKFLNFRIKSPVASTVFWMTLFEEVLNASVADF